MPSAVWGEWFVKERLKDGKVQAKCQKCTAAFAFHSSTSNLISHVKTAHGVDLKPLPAKDGRKRSFECSDRDETNIDSDVEASNPHEPLMPRIDSTDREGSSSQGVSYVTSSLLKCVNNMNAFSVGGARDAQCNNALMYMVIKDGMPIDTPEKKGFRVFVNSLQPLYKPPSEPTPTRMLERKYLLLREDVGKLLSEAEHITLTAGIWTQKNTMRSYLGLTAHFSLEDSERVLFVYDWKKAGSTEQELILIDN